jgi:hypothetical protein
MEPKDSLSCPQEPASGSCAERRDTARSSRLPALFLWRLLVSSPTVNVLLDCPIIFSLWGLQRPFCTNFSFFPCATCHRGLESSSNISWIVQIMMGCVRQFSAVSRGFPYFLVSKHFLHVSVFFVVHYERRSCRPMNQYVNLQTAQVEYSGYFVCIADGKTRDSALHGRIFSPQM